MTNANAPGKLLPFKPRHTVEVKRSSVLPRLGAVRESEFRARRIPIAPCFEATVRQTPRHPIWHITCAAGRVLERVLNGMQIALFAYYAALGLTAFPLLASGQYAGGIAMALVGGTFGSLLLARLRPQRLEESRPDHPPKVRGIDYLRWKKYGEWRRRVMRAEAWMRRASQTSPPDSA